MKSTQRIQPCDSNQAIDHLQKRFQAWRKNRRPRTRIPKRLWESAVQVAGQCGLNRTAKALHLDYYALKKRLEASGPEKASMPAFIECVLSARLRNAIGSDLILSGCRRGMRQEDSRC